MFRPFPSLVAYPDALAALLSFLTPRAPEDVPLDEAAGRVLARDVLAPADVPAFDRCAMDGYAVRAADVARATRDHPAALPVVAEGHAGDPRRALAPGQAVQVATGAVLPEGADCVIMAEQTRRDGRTVHVLEPAHVGAHVSARGGDFAKGARILRAGRLLDAAAVALAASLGVAKLAVARRPRVAILPSGTEVVAPGEPLREGQVYDSNSRGLAALATRLGADARRLPPMADTREAHAAAIAAAARDADLVVTTGGTSVGERDLLAPLVAEHGEVRAHGVRLKPGRPVLVGRWGATPILGLPGYPASMLVTAELFLAPALRALAGEARRPAPPARATWTHDVAARHDFTTIVPVRVEDGRATSTYKESGTITSISESDGYVVFPEGSKGARAGDAAEVRAWSWA